MSAWAKPGVKCICITDAFVAVDGGYTPFKKGERLTITHTHVFPGYGLMLTFAERESDHWGHVDGFRPLVTPSQEQDMAIFRPFLNSISVGEDA